MTAVQGPGLNKTKNFVFSEAELMIAPQGIAGQINKRDHAIGLVKDVSISLETTVQKLTQGVTNMVADTQVTGAAPKFTANVFEFTPKNLTYGLSLDAANFTPGAGKAVYPLAADVTGDGETPAEITIAGDVTSVANGAKPWTVGMWVFLQAGLGSSNVFVSKIVSAPTVAAGVSTVELADPVPEDLVFSHFVTKVGVTAKIDADQNAMDNSYTVRVAGILKSSKTPLIVHMPSAKIMKGFNLAFNSRDFSSMPFEFDVLFPSPDDPGYSPDYPVAMSIFPGAQ